MNLGNRPTRVYRELSRLPNVQLIDAFDTQFKYLKYADLVVTENGSSGWEGLLLRRPTLLLSQTFYEGAGLGTSVLDPERMNAGLLEALAERPDQDSNAYDHALACMIDGELETTFAMNAQGSETALRLLARTISGPLRMRREQMAAA